MKILSVHIDGFGKFQNTDIPFDGSVNVIRGQNEAGKSTLHAFLEAMLLGANRKPRGFSKSVYEAMIPWDDTAPYAGSMRIEHNGKTYRIERNFEVGKEMLRVIDEETDACVDQPEEFLKEVLQGLTPDACRNTISIGQLSAKTGAALQKELASYIENIGTTANPQLNAERAIEHLKEKKKHLEGLIREDAAKEYAASLSRIKNIENELNRPENDNHILQFEGKRQDVRSRMSTASREISETGDRIEEATRVLLEHNIRDERDVEALCHTRDELVREYRECEKKKKTVLRVIVILASLLLFGASVAGAYTQYPDGSWVWFVPAAVISLVVFIGSVSALVTAVKNYNEAKKELLKFMQPRTGAKDVTEETLKQLDENIHSCDPILKQRQEDTQRKDTLNNSLSVMVKEDEEYTENIEEQNRIKHHVETKLTEENELRSEAAGLRHKIAENNRLKEEIDAIDIAIDTIGDLSSSIRTRLGTYLNNEASRALQKLTDGHYRSMDIGGASDLSLNSPDGMIAVNDVSAGTIDQVYLAVRLAAARFMMGKGDTLPLIFDDSFALYDDERLKSALEYVTGDYQGQIFIFTCHHREERALEDGKYSLTEL